MIHWDMANNIKSYRLDYAHLFILAAESEKGRKNVYKGRRVMIIF